MKTKHINLALQGGGAHGGFTWGVLDRLLEDERIVIDGVSGSSAGAMNAAVMANGFARGGPEEARRALDAFWGRVGEIGQWSPLREAPMHDWFGTWNTFTMPTYMAFDMVTRVLSPYQFNPMNYHPLRDLLREFMGGEGGGVASPISVYVCATNVRTGKIHIFDRETLSVDAVLASACLPFLFQAVEIDGEAYWDGSYVGNPALYPLIGNGAAQDIVLVQICPLYRPELPKTAPEILDRVNEISFNAALLREMRTIALMTRLIDEGALNHPDYRPTYVHMIGAEEEMRALGIASKLAADPPFLAHLKGLGRTAADQWLATAFDSLGEASTIDLDGLFL